ncbi:Marine sediment metagenome DNA, contig: S01H1_L02418 OS=marine sediment metagenome GN=S01H1_08263 PE=4 SV=1 [Gemmata massiliana]|uniref:Marine sediment metagenome DNA, contig: S01H1_L02418 n=1 Tax=Gemmata massiliana TaxID=1210884 RepID=A0A6P2DGC4_9BACT|nr:hypothetical protein [Gemmata massiliana]VTS00782.1 Marine sediment metagenome DNA, contig: S01H1_L02418 OS=marine sediment metagenome GN=S01H1_08263 PE=4 SV=1 [Gemmata massiliana]
MSNTAPNPDDTPPAPRKLTPELTEAIAAIILSGNFRYVACKRVGIGQRTFKRWMALGKKYPSGIYGGFRRVVVAAETEAETRAVAAIIRAGQEDAKHLEWWLERKFPQRWGRGRGELLELKREIAELRKQIGPAACSE